MNVEWTRKTLLVGAIAASLSLAACGENRNDATRPADRPASTSSATTDRMTADASAAANRAAAKADAAGDTVAAKASDAATTAKVKSRLMAEPGIDSLQIDVDTSNGRVTLTGEVDTPEHKARAKELAGSIEGVSGVTDRMVVKR